MNSSNNVYRDLMTKLLLATGILSFMSGQFVASTFLFGMSFLSSNLVLAKPVRA
ncbi:hypothetical protein [Methylomonas rivi]|uniref:Uncharacterized protein n=1 Tax=Methylomonas rivi TaxID=2952226 RepID=A0ABT1U4M0_9GAMM|nr:hypothetical protein [Methylomonas sp. WSC-6]MBS4051895.1 hypothetical protein [Methylomonas sp.]MCQ8128374.1 hypothetical protein [Methylomonas sp. WSC-6]